MNGMQRVALIGTGVMGGAILAALRTPGARSRDVVLVDSAPGRAARVAAEHGVGSAERSRDAVRGADVVVIAVKPKDVAAVLADIGTGLGPDSLVVSVAVGLDCAFYEVRLPAGVPVVRVMPNTPATIGRGVSAISAGSSAREEHLAVVEDLLAATGLVVRVAEKDQDAVAAISGSGPAYVFYVIDALAEAGVLMGLPRDLATTLATETVLGAAQLASTTGEHPAVLRERVSSPGGTTVVALHHLDVAGVRAAFVDAADAARRRSRELGVELSATPAASPPSTNAPR
jgi:pyrroline-5-carboxylate reductase